MAQLRQDSAEFEKRHAAILVIGPEDRKAFADYWAKNSLSFTGLPDPDHRVLDLYGQEFKILKLGRMPAQVVIDGVGVVRYAHYGDSMADIPANEEILALIDEIAGS